MVDVGRDNLDDILVRRHQLLYHLLFYHEHLLYCFLLVSLSDISGEPVFAL